MGRAARIDMPCCDIAVETQPAQCDFVIKAGRTQAADLHDAGSGRRVLRERWAVNVSARKIGVMFAKFICRRWAVTVEHQAEAVRRHALKTAQKIIESHPIMHGVAIPVADVGQARVAMARDIARAAERGGMSST